MSEDLTGRRIVVTGAAGALGGAIARGAVAAGADVVGFERFQPPPEQCAPGVRYLAVDVLDDPALAEAFDDAWDGAPPWAVLNVVGGFAGARPLTDFDPAELSAQVQLNLASAALLTKHSLRRMTTVRQGRIVHTASRAALQTDGAGFAYSVSKLGVLHLVQMAARETQGTAITVNAVVPSIMDTPANRAAIPTADYATWPSVTDVAAVFLFLASPAAALISGAALPVYGLT